MNKDYIWYFLFLVIFVIATFNGVIIIKTKSFRNPTNNKYVEGNKALLVGGFFVFLGVLSLVFFLFGMNIFLRF